jgi:hypothetical protein
MRNALFLLAAFSLACGGAERRSDAGRDSSVADARIDSSLDCSAVGCALAPRCELGCTEACGCCGCAEGEVRDLGGDTRVCVAGCFARIIDAAVDAASDAGGDASAADAGATDSGAGDSGATDSGVADAGTSGTGGDTCGDALDVTAGITLAGETTTTATDDYSPPIGMGCPSGGAASGRDRAYFVEPAAATDYRVTVTPAADFDPMLFLVTACDFSAGCVDGTVLNGSGTPESLTFSASAGTRIYIIVAGALVSRGSYELRVEVL